MSCRKVDCFKSFISLSWMNSIILKRPCIFSWMKSLLVLTDLEWPDEIVYIISFICIDWINLLIQGEIWLNKPLKICESLTLFFCKLNCLHMKAFVIYTNVQSYTIDDDIRADFSCLSIYLHLTKNFKLVEFRSRWTPSLLFW